jgi:excisionase family DNA binding protein
MTESDNVRPLLTIEEAAAKLNVPKQSLRSAAQAHGMLVKMGRAVRIDPDQLKELIDKCRENPRDRASTGGETRKSGSSGTPGGPTYRPALETAAMLKRH